jgi:hypothetical protein
MLWSTIPVCPKVIKIRNVFSDNRAPIQEIVLPQQAILIPMTLRRRSPFNESTQIHRPRLLKTLQQGSE